MGARTGRAVPRPAAQDEPHRVARRRARRRRHRAPGAGRRRAARWRACSTASTSYADECLIPDPETGEPISISHMIPRSVEDLKRRNRGLIADLRGDRGADGAHARLHERQVRLLRRPPRHLGGRGPRQRGGRAEPRPVPAAPGPRGSLAHPHDHPAHDRQGDRSPDRGEPGHAPQGRRDRDGHRGARGAHPRDARALRRRDRRLPGPADPGRGRAPTPWPSPSRSTRPG